MPTITSKAESILREQASILAAVKADGVLTTVINKVASMNSSACVQCA
jgi:hypothetical protein